MRRLCAPPRYKFGFRYLCISPRLDFCRNPFIEITYIKTKLQKISDICKFFYL